LSLDGVREFDMIYFRLVSFGTVSGAR